VGVANLGVFDAWHLLQCLLDRHATELQARFATATSGIGNVGQARLSKVTVGGLWGQFVIGLVRGAFGARVWDQR
jgi:hypothetical protein